LKHILAVDIGTTSAKAIVVSEKGEVLSHAQEFYPTYQPHPSYSEQNPEEIFSAVKRIIHAAADKVSGKVDGVSFSSAMHSLILVDERGEAITPMITWADMRSKDEARELKNKAEGPTIYYKSGTPIHPCRHSAKCCGSGSMRRNYFNEPRNLLVSVNISGTDFLVSMMWTIQSHRLRVYSTTKPKPGQPRR